MNNIIKRLKNTTHSEVLKAVIMLYVFFTLLSFLFFPLCMLFVKAFQNKDSEFVWFQQFTTYFSSPNMVNSLLNTISISIWSTVIAILFAFGFAYNLSRRNIFGKKFFQLIALLPIFAPTMLLGIALTYLFGNQGLITKLGWDINLYGRTGIIIAESIFCFPVAVMVLGVAFSSADNRLYEAADVMGTSNLRKMLTITLPNIKYGLINAIFICFTYSFTDFGAPSVVGGSYNVLATDIYKQVIGQQNFNLGAVVGILMMIPTVFSFAIDRFVSSKQGSSVSSKAVAYNIKPSKIQDTLAFAFCSFVSILIIGFFIVALFASLVSMWPYNMSLTLKHYDFKNSSGSGLLAIKNSLQVSLITAFIGTIFTFTTAYIIEKVNLFPKLKKGIYFLSIAPMAIPGTVIGLSFILFFNPKTFAIPFTDFSIVNSLQPLYGTIWILVIVNIIHYFSVPFVTASTALRRLDKEFETVADSLSIPFYKTFVSVTVPMCFGAIVEMFVYFFVNAMITVSAVVFLYTPVTKLVSVTILNMRDAGDMAMATAMSMLIFGINVIIRLIYELFRTRITNKTNSWQKR